MENSFLHSIQAKKNEILNKNTVRESSLNEYEKKNIYSELNHIYQNDNYPVVNSIETQTDFEQKKQYPMCTSLSGSLLITLTLITANNFLLYYFTNMSLN